MGFGNVAGVPLVLTGFGNVARSAVVEAPFALANVPWIRWLDADDLVGATPTDWPDHDAGPTLTAHGSPTKVDAEINGHAVARFVAASLQYFGGTGGTSLNTATEFTSVVLFRVTAAGPMIFYHLGNEVSRFAANALDLTVVPDDTVAGYGATTDTPISSNVWHLAILRYDGAGATNADRLRLRIDGVDRTLSFTGTVPASIASADNTEIGRWYSNNYYLDGDFALGLTAAVCLSDAVTDQLEALLNTTYGLLPQGNTMPDKPCTGCPHCNDRLASLEQQSRETQRWSAFGSAAGTAIVLTAWHVLTYLLRLP